MCSVSTFLSTLPGYLLSQDSQPSTTSHQQELQCKTPSRAQYATGWIPAQAIRSSTVATTKTSSRRNQHVHSTKEQPSQTRQPNLLQQAIEAASRVRHPAFLNTPPEKTPG